VDVISDRDDAAHQALTALSSGLAKVMTILTGCVYGYAVNECTKTGSCRVTLFSGVKANDCIERKGNAFITKGLYN
jgi:hypothetical protein